MRAEIEPNIQPASSKAKASEQRNEERGEGEERWMESVASSPVAKVFKVSGNKHRNAGAVHFINKSHLLNVMLNLNKGNTSIRCSHFNVS